MSSFVASTKMSIHPRRSPLVQQEPDHSTRSRLMRRPNLTQSTPRNKSQLTFPILQWYKGSHEFYRHYPMEDPPTTVVSWSSFNIEVGNNNNNNQHFFPPFSFVKRGSVPLAHDDITSLLTKLRPGTWWRAVKRSYSLVLYTHTG